MGYRVDGLLTVFIEKKRKPVVMSREEFVNRGGANRRRLRIG